MIKKSISLLIAIALILSFNLMIPFPAEALGNSPLTGLLTLKTMAKEATPYQEAIANNKPTLLEFYADWCSTCQGMSPTVKDLADKYGDRVNLVMLNIDDPQWDHLVQKYKVTGIPQYTFINADTKIVDTLIGKVPKTIMDLAFDQLVEFKSS